jgi:zinc/manganese transport system permease protein
MPRGRLGAGYALGLLGYVVGLVVSAAADLPAGPAIVWALAVVALAFVLATRRSPERSMPRAS